MNADIQRAITLCAQRNWPFLFGPDWATNLDQFVGACDPIAAACKKANVVFVPTMKVYPNGSFGPAVPALLPQRYGYAAVWLAYYTGEGAWPMQTVLDLQAAAWAALKNVPGLLWFNLFDFTRPSGIADNPATLGVSMARLIAAAPIAPPWPFTPVPPVREDNLCLLVSAHP